MPGAQVRVHAVAHTCKCNYDDKDIPVSHREIHQNDDMHCSVEAFRLIMERLPRRPQIEPGSTTGWGALRAKKNSDWCDIFEKVVLLSQGAVWCPSLRSRCTERTGSLPSCEPPFKINSVFQVYYKFNFNQNFNLSNSVGRRKSVCSMMSNCFWQKRRETEYSSCVYKH